MLRIAICDDNAHVCAELKAFCASFLSDKADFRLHTFNNGLQLLSSQQVFDVLFLDVEMPFLDGFGAAEELNKRNKDTRIIFLTNHPELMQKAFKVKAFRYLIKPVSQKELEEALLDAIKDINSNIKVIVDCSTADGRTEVIVYEKDIVYIEAMGDGVVIYTVNQGNLISRRSLKYWAENLSKATFFQTHKSYIVSLAHVEGIKKSAVTIVYSKEIPLAKRKATQFKECVALYMKST